MTKGLWIALSAHLLGTVLAIALGWQLPTWIAFFEPVRPAQYAFATVALAWGIWKAREIVIGKDSSANRTAAHFNANKRR
ncbi:hypothetical protein [Duganella vulcania]|uniref:Uncharacterized protein n=1 Tax=Duganella vulcania TaxID=2692166 RepID=A0A845GUV8_9BURK|nr:hypothetical protein [Duganella vulcania]MYM96457.1 hypothetical protein [Duganella vulcania]